MQTQASEDGDQSPLSGRAGQRFREKVAMESMQFIPAMFGDFWKVVWTSFAFLLD
jgi:hypothetical protein